MVNVYRFRKPIAALLLLIFSTSTFWPAATFALTSGPQQPEMKGFQAIGVNDMVDLFSGDFHYNIPLMDVGGYPLNLSYNSGQSMDDESSWVGFGWNLNPGAVNRQLRGIPDDFNGDSTGGDRIEKQVAEKPYIIKSISPVIKLKRKGKPLPRVPIKVPIGISENNYTGVKAEIGFNASLSMTNACSLPGTINLGIKSDNQQGGTFHADINPYTISKSKWNSEFKLSGSIGFDYNATRGIEGLTLGGSFSMTNNRQNNGKPLVTTNLEGFEFISFAGESYIPAVDIPRRTKSFTFGLRAGPSLFGVSGLFGASGLYSKQDIAPGDRRKFFPAYGLMNAVAAKNNKDALMDFNRENDRPYHPKLPYLPVPVVNQDLLSVTSQNSSGQYKVSLSGSGILSDNYQRSNDTKLGFGLEVGFGNVVHVGISDLSYNKLRNTSGKWTSNNDFQTNGDFNYTSASNAQLPEAVFKKVGENVMNDPGFYSKTGTKEASYVSLRDDGWAKTFGRGTALNKLKTKSGRELNSLLRKDAQDKRGEVFGYLKASEAQYYGLEKMIPSYPVNTIVVNGCNDNQISQLPRISSTAGKKANHISEITVTSEGGARQVYGIPVYNTRQDEVSFSIKDNETYRKKGLIRYGLNEDSVPTSDADTRMKSKDYNYHFFKQRLGGYAASWLLTGILSPDYVDVTGDGISDDDLGTAVKFNYSNIGTFKWRTPFFNLDGVGTERIANYNEGLLADKKDDMASYVYGEKEQWYLHSIESKTMLALFILEDRDDGLGVNNSDGAVNTSFRLKRLKEIRLYSKAELYKNRNNFNLTTPVKTVHFEYSYELFSNLPNSLAQGKLTLKKVYFTFYKNGQGKLHPYKFNYNVPAYQAYQYRQYDRWGMYKPADSANRNGLNNAEFPYSTQNHTDADRWAGYWQLSGIDLPSGGSINITYESDDYAYVQNKRAAAMCFIKGVGALNQHTGVNNANTIFIELPQPVADVKELKERYFEGMNYLYFKVMTDLDNRNSPTEYDEYIPGYAKIEKIDWVDNTTAKVTVSKVDGYSPISKAAWQIMQNSLPRLAYPEYDNLNSDESDFVKAIKALGSAISRISDIVRSFDSRARKRHFADKIDLTRSWVRLCSPDYKKAGGGSRVKRIMMSDKWNEMTGDPNTETASYGQAYYYTTEKTLSNGQVVAISSGVASYEPSVGADENPFKQPVEFTQKRFMGLDQHYYLELPLCESYYPAASVGYSKVTMKNIGADGIEGSTGSTTSEFFTAKDFPTRVEASELQKVQPKLRKILRLFSVKITDHATVSQGYVVENYNMHGKQKAERIVDKNGQEISAVFYEYRTDNKSSGKPALNNLVPVIDKSGQVNQAQLGVDVDFFTDMNEHQTENYGVAGEPSGGFFFAGFFPRPWFYWGGFSPNYDKRLFRSSVAIKIINSFPILDKVIRVEKGSRVETQNVLWDAETGDVLLTKTQNEFDEPIYSFNYPAHWVYDGMGPAYKTQGLYLANFGTNADGVISNSAYNSFLVPGDELINVSNVSEKYWIIKATDNTLRVVNEDGLVTQLNNPTVKVLRSGRRNLSSSPVGTLVSLHNPIVAGQLKIDYFTQVLDAKTVVFGEEWALPIKMKCNSGCPPGYTQGSSGFCYSSFVNASACANYQLCHNTDDAYSYYGSVIYEPGYSLSGSGTRTPLAAISLWKNTGSLTGPLNRNGVWVCGTEPDSSIWVGFSKKITVSESKYYYIGIGADNYAQLKVNGQTIVQFGYSAPNGLPFVENFRYWHIYPVYLNAGTHLIEMYGRNQTSVASFGCEIYNNTKSQIINATSIGNLNILFATSTLFGQYSNVSESMATGCKTCQTGYAYNPDDGKCYLMTQPNANGNVFNPYTTNLLGNWRPVKDYVFDVYRTNMVGDNTVMGGTNVRKQGYYSSFDPYWTGNGTNFTANTSSPSFSKWIWRNETTLINNKGLEVENRDVLGRYSAMQAGYLQSVPVAVAANARLRDIAYDGFEDYGFALTCQPDTCNAYPGHFNFQKIINNNTIKLDTAFTHSGNYSLKLSTSATITRNIASTADTLYTRDAKSQFNLKSNFLMNGFSPVAGGRYVLSFWVRNGNAANVYPGVNVSINGATIINANTYKAPVVEGWKRVDTIFTIPSGATSFQLTINPVGGTVYIDDIRIHPYDAQLKSYAYDANSLRLMAELDENNFATFYEYDDEGILIRVKKETEKGTMTIRESRTGVKRTSN